MEGTKAQLEAEKYCYRTVLRVAATVTDNIYFFLGGVPYRLLDDNCPSPNDWTPVEADFESLETARAQLLSLGAAVEVIEPEALRLSIQNFAEHIMRLYQT
jgi:predicted DNA-binding transcriptional regulator YafY